MKKYLLLGLTYVLNPIFLFGDCDSGYVEILDIPESVTVLDGSNCFYQSDLDVLQDFIDLNESLSGEPLEIGNQEWNGGRLTKLDINYIQLTSLPESIGNLSSLEGLYLYNNQLTSLPESICNIPGTCYISVENNQLCEEYHYNCIDNWGEQDCLSISEPTLPITYNLSSPYPNPFNPTTTVQFSIPKSDLVSIKVYDIHGREVTTLVNDYLHTGYHTISWNGYKSTSGIYFIRMEGEEFVQTRKVMLLK